MEPTRKSLLGGAAIGIVVAVIGNVIYGQIAEAIRDRPNVVLTGTRATVPFEPLEVVKHRFVSRSAPQLIFAPPGQPGAPVKTSEEFAASFDRVLSTAPLVAGSSQLTYWELTLTNRGSLKADNIRLTIPNAYALDYGGKMIWGTPPSSPFSSGSVPEISISSMQATDSVGIRAWASASSISDKGSAAFVKYDQGVGTVDVEDMTSASTPFWPFILGALAAGLVNGLGTLGAEVALRLKRRRVAREDEPTA